MAKTEEMTPEQLELASLERQIAEARSLRLAKDGARVLDEKRAELRREQFSIVRDAAVEQLEKDHNGAFKRIGDSASDYEPGTVGAYAEVPHEKAIIAIVRGQGIIFHRYKRSKMRDADDLDFVIALGVHPDKSAFADLLDRNPGLTSSLMLAGLKLYGLKIEEDRGK